MTTMAFATDPGELPFVTIRDAKWANRLVDLPMPIRIYGEPERGCGMRKQVALVTKVERLPPGTPSVYADKRPLVAVYLEKPARCASVHAWDHEIQMCAHCGLKREDFVNVEASC